MTEIHPSLQIAEFGPSIGTYRDKDIAAWMTKDGARWNYDRVAYEDDDGSCPLAQLRDDEFVVAPGLIYRRATYMTNEMIQQEVARAQAHFATISSDKVRDLGKIAGIVSRQGRRGEQECAIAKAIAAAARSELRRRMR